MVIDETAEALHDRRGEREMLDRLLDAVRQLPQHAFQPGVKPAVR